jgi:non-heme chloroperoxidase
MPNITLDDGVNIYVEDKGNGEITVVFLHGVMMSGQFFQKQLDYFSKFSRVIIPDYRGHGQSEKILRGHTVKNYARDLRDLLNKLEVKKPILGWLVYGSNGYS